MFINGTFRHFQIPEFRKACYLLTSSLAAATFVSLSHSKAVPSQHSSREDGLGFGQRRGIFIGLWVLSTPSHPPQPPQGAGHRFHSVNSLRNPWRRSWDGLGRDKTQGIREQLPKVLDCRTRGEDKKPALEMWGKEDIWKCFSNVGAGQSLLGTAGWRMRMWIVRVQHRDLWWENLYGRDREGGMGNLGCRTASGGCWGGVS